MHNPIELDIEAIEKEAQEAAFFHDNINAACPYPFATMAGAVFKEAFFKAQQDMAAAQQTKATMIARTRHNFGIAHGPATSAAAAQEAA